MRTIRPFSLRLAGTASWAGALLLLAGCLAAAPTPGRGGQDASPFDEVLELYRAGGVLNRLLAADIELLAPGPEGRPLLGPGHFLYRPLNDRSLTPMGFAAGARWLRARLIEVRGPVPAPSGRLIGWVRAEGAKDERRSVRVGALRR